MSRFDFQSPGAAVADSMAKVLTQRKVEERQAMLDRLTQSADERAWRAEDRAVEQQKSDTKWRDAQTEQQNWAKKKQQFDTLVQFYDPSKPLSQQGATPEHVALFREFGALREQPKVTPGVSTDESFSAPPGAEYGIEGEDMEPWLGGMPQAGPAPTAEPKAPAAAPKEPEMEQYFAGSGEYQQLQKQKRADGELVATLVSSADPNDKRIGNALARMMVDGVIPKEGRDLLKPNKPVMWFDQDTADFGELEGGVSPDTQILNRVRAPKQPVAPRQKYIGTNPEGYPIFERPDGTIFVDTTTKLGGKDTGQQALGVTNDTKEDHRISIAQVDLEANPQTVSVFKQTAREMITEARVTPRVRSIAFAYLDNPMAAAQATSAISEMEKAQLEALLNVIGAKRFVKHLTPQEPQQ